MNELEKIWPTMLDSVERMAIDSGRHELAEYLRLKATNDAVRTTAVAWLMDTFVELAGEAMSNSFNLLIEREDPYSFSRGNSTLVGSLVEVKQGVRKLSLAAGWTRAPSHGVMEKGALAYARFTHLGMPKAGAEFRLVRGEDLPQWISEDTQSIDIAHLRHHLDIFLS